MYIRRLGWAGIELEAGGRTAVIDLFQNVGRMRHFVGDPRGPLPGPREPGSAQLALMTHLHEDHADARAVAEALAPDGLVLRPEVSAGGDLEAAGLASAEAALVERGLAARVVAPWETVERDGFRITAVPAVDGFGDPQVSWVVEAGGRRILHAGDTTFHGWWWPIRERLGPLDVAFLPVNGPTVDLPHRQPPSPLEAAMGPRSAAVAAAILRCAVAVPIHYDTLNNPPIYAQVDDPAGAFTREATALGVTVRVLEAGDEL